MQFQRFQRNIDQVAGGLPKLPGVDSPAAIRARVEGQPAQKYTLLNRTGEQSEVSTLPNRTGQQAKAVPLGSGDYRNASGKKMQVGDEAYVNKRYVGTVSKVYQDGSYDVQPD
jgi:hypothetical protein